MVVDAQELVSSLRRWSDAGLLDPGQADRIVAFEHDRVPGPAAPPHAPPISTPHPEGAPSRRSRIAEAVGYVGAAFALGAVALILADLWQELTPWGRVTLVGLVVVVTAAASIATRGSTAPTVQRLGSVLSAVAVVAVAWLAGVVTADVLEWSWRDVTTAVTVAAVVAAVPAYLARRRPLPQVVLLLSILAATEAVLFRSSLQVDIFWPSLVAVAIAGAWVLLGVGGWLRPATTATTAGGVIALFALQCGSFGDWRPVSLLLGVVLAGGAVAAAVVTGRAAHLAIGAVGLFVLLPQLVIDIFGDAIGAPATLLAVGLLLVLLAVGLGRVKREVDTSRPTLGGAK